MNMALTPLRQTKGSILVLTALSLLVIMGMLGLAIDLGNAYVNKTRLQNALDAMVLSAAISLVNERVANAVADAQDTFDEFDISSVDATTDIDICFFNNYSDINANSPCDTLTPTAASKFVRAAMKPGSSLSVATTFASLIGFNNTNIVASAVSGPLSLNNLCTLVPILACAEMTNTLGTGTVRDSDCSDGVSCYGYNIGSNYTLKLTDWTDLNIGSGNFGLMDVGTGGSAVCDAMASSVSCRVLGATADSETGNAAGPTACLNVRFDDYTHGRAARYPPATNKPDTNITEYTTATTHFPTYLSNLPESPGNLASGHAAEKGRRVVHIPFVDCADGKGHGSSPSTTLDVQGMGCFLVTKKVIEGGSNPDKHKVFTEFIGDEDSDPLCEIGSKSLPNANASPFAPTRVVLFKDPVSGDA